MPQPTDFRPVFAAVVMAAATCAAFSPAHGAFFAASSGRLQELGRGHGSHPSSAAAAAVWPGHRSAGHTTDGPEAASLQGIPQCLGITALLLAAARLRRAGRGAAAGRSRPPARDRGPDVVGCGKVAAATRSASHSALTVRRAASSDADGPAAATQATGAWTRRDQLLRIEEDIRKLWEDRAVYEEDAPAEDLPKDAKFFVTFPYPYMNGRLHLGHAFSITKAEFAARFARLDGKRVLFPFAFHCTGMPIAAAAMKLEKILAARGEESGEELEQDVPVAVGAEDSTLDATTEPGVFKAKKSKVAAKTGGLDQYSIMKALGIAETEIPQFTQPEYWLKYFPPLATQDLKSLGVAVDWRRSFITTDVNPYYDAFVRWQFLKLNKGNFLANGKRESIFSIATNQPCADHDRAEGEGVNPMEYTLIKLKVQEVPEDWLTALGEADVFLVAATLRPETMYGQTNCFVLPEGDYGFFRMASGDVFVCTRRSALNMCYQGLGELQKDAETGEAEPHCLLEKKGADLVGLQLKAPLAKYETVYALPMLTISMEKGTGIVTSVPAEAPDDFACLSDWQKRENWRTQFGVKEEWCQPFEVVEFMEIPDSDFGTASAPYICEKLKIGSHKEKDKLAVAKKEVYMKGFYSGILTVGPYAGQKVSDVKQQIKQDLIESGDAAPYFEPESRVIARSGDECIVALCDQWYLKYSDDRWTQSVRTHLEQDFNMFNEAALNNLSYAVGWLGDWACSRTFGLGSKLPWDEKWLIESLSDSTIYMAYYTIAHVLQGESGGAGAEVDAADLTEEVFDYVFCLRGEPPSDTKIPKDVLEKMRREFKFWYPVDLRCSGKDLIQNHLTMSLFNHAAVWEDPKFWPQAFFCNGHVMIDSEKMSKSKGNFLTLEEAIASYSADAVRITCADSGDTLQDANFSRENAGKTILRLTTLEAWAKETVQRLPSLRTGSFTFLDSIFDNEISSCVEAAQTAYRGMLYTDALRAAFYDVENLRSQYSILTNEDPHAEVLRRMLEVQMVMLSPIAPHFCEHVWRNVMGKETLVVQERWPVLEKEVDVNLCRQYELIQGTLRTFRLELDKFMSPGKKKKKQAKSAPPAKPTHAVIFVAKSYQKWQKDILGLLQGIELDSENNPVEKDFMRKVKDSDVVKAMTKQEAKKAMPFAAQLMKTQVKEKGLQALELELPFDEAAMLRDLLTVIKRQLFIDNVEIAEAEEEHPRGAEQKRLAAGPGKPQISFLVEEVEAA